MIGNAYGWDRGDKERIQNFDGETFWKTATIKLRRRWDADRSG
jgi:hypothetical protein